MQGMVFLDSLWMATVGLGHLSVWVALHGKHCMKALRSVQRGLILALFCGAAWDHVGFALSRVRSYGTEAHSSVCEVGSRRCVRDSAFKKGRKDSQLMQAKAYIEVNV